MNLLSITLHLGPILKARDMMSIEHKYCYVYNGVYLITKQPSLEYEQVSMPFNIYKDKLKILAAYVRWSDRGQTLGHSLEMQVREIIARAKIEGYQIVILFIDEATSAYHTPAQNRSEMLNMKNFILSNENVCAAIFYEESRITRLIEDFALYILGPIKQARPNFVVFSTKIEGEWDENNPYVQARLSFAHEEAVVKSDNGYSFHKSVVIDSPNPQRPGSRNPFGYQNTTLRADDLSTNEYADIVVLIFYLYSFGYSDKKIAELLNAAQIPPPSLHAKKGWSDSSVRYILCNYWYSGNLAWFTRTSYHNSKKMPIDESFLLENHHEALIGPNLWNTTQYFRNYKKNNDRMNSPFILRNIVVCEKCDQSLNTKNATPAKSSKKYLYYTCPSCKEKILMEELQQIVLSDFSIRWSRELKHYLEKVKKILQTWDKVLNDQIMLSKAQLDTLKYNHSMLKVDSDLYDDLKESFDYQIQGTEKLKQQYYETKEQIGLLMDDPTITELLGRFKIDIHEYTFEEQRSLILLSIQKISIDFNKVNQVSIEYRLTPFVDIENLINSFNNETA